MSTRIGVATAIIGCGKVSEQHLIALKSIPKVEVVSVCDRSPALARFAAERFQVRQWYCRLEEMLDAHRPRVVHILTPPSTHQAIAGACMVSGSHVIVEKPVALCREGFRTMWHCAQEHRVQLVENHNYRFNEPMQWLDEQVSRGAIGSVEEVEVRMALRVRDAGRYADASAPHPSHRLPAGVIHEFISHLCYLALRFVDGRPDSVRAEWRNLGGGSLFKYDDLDARIEFGAARVRLRFTSRQWPDEFSVTVRGSDGQAAIEMFNPTRGIVRKRGGSPHLVPFLNSLSAAKSALSSGVGGLWGKIAGHTVYEGLERFMHLTYAAIERGHGPPVTFVDMDRTSQLIDALLAPENQV